jgi:general secretion pathway protein J
MTTDAQPSDRHGEQGFTLLELIVTLGLLSLIVAAIMGGLGTGRRVWQMRGDLEQVSALGAVRSLLQARVADALPVSEHATKGVPIPAFDGAADSLTFVAPVTRGSNGPGLFRHVIRMVPATGGTDLRDLVLEGPSAHPAILVHNVAQISLRYLGLEPAQPGPQWSSSWRGKAALPRLIGLTVSFPRGDPRQWPELILAPTFGPAS